MSTRLKGLSTLCRLWKVATLSITLFSAMNVPSPFNSTGALVTERLVNRQKRSPSPNTHPKSGPESADTGPLRSASLMASWMQSCTATFFKQRLSLLSSKPFQGTDSCRTMTPSIHHDELGPFWRRQESTGGEPPLRVQI